MDLMTVSMSEGGQGSGVEDMIDPSVAEGYRVVYDRECPFELRQRDDQSTLEAVKVKILILGDDANPHSVRVEISSENDLYFLYVHDVEEPDFRVMIENQKLMIDFSEYVNVLVKMLNSCIKEPHAHLAVLFFLDEDEPGLARLDFIKNMEYKFVELLTCTLHRSPDDLVKRHLSYRYRTLKSRLNTMQTRMNDLSTLVKSKNPSLLLHLQQQAQAQQQSNNRGDGGDGSSTIPYSPKQSTPSNNNFNAIGSSSSRQQRNVR